ncbi:MAG: sulfate ABC transporter permease subunit CysT [Anaerolineae bacterium]|nr:sulfate ABC transporter permease subunit CysT [Anaerolineae bacterium]
MAQAVAHRDSVSQASNPQMLFWGLRLSVIIYLSVMIIMPLFVISVEGLREGFDAFWMSITRPVAWSAIWLSVWTAGVMAIINIIMGTTTAYVLVRYRFWGKNLLNSLIDLPFAIPTLVTGVMLTLLYGPQTPVGKFLNDEFGIKVLYSQVGIILALLFLGYPFVIRAVQPVMMKLDAAQQEAAYTLGASQFTTFRRVILPALLPAMITGGLLSFARALGEFGSVVIISGNIPKKTQTAAVYVYGEVEGNNMASASGVSLVILFIALVTTLGVNYWYKRQNKRVGRAL